MEIEVLGCYGGEVRGRYPPSLLIDGSVMLDAGSFGARLSLQRQLGIEHVLLSHSHSDHVKDLPCFADLVIGKRRRPVAIHATRKTLQVLRGNLFNNRLWPDFFLLPSPEQPVLREAPFISGRWFRLGHLRVKAVPVIHPVESMAFVVRGDSGSFVYSGDTGPNDSLWRVVNRLRDLRLLLVEVKFPNSLQVVADAAGHLTPRTLAQQLAKLNGVNVPILLYHLKPEYVAEIGRQVRALADSRLRLLRQGERLRV